jgi:hypothetical protein
MVDATSVKVLNCFVNYKVLRLNSMNKSIGKYRNVPIYFTLPAV